MAITVLLVDDVVHVRRLVRTALRFRGGFEVVGEADDGTQAVRFAGELQPDIVVLDLGLPDLAGHEVLSSIREASPRSKVVVFSGGDSHDQTWVKERVEGYVLKDAEIDYLIDLLQTVSEQTEDEAVLELPRDLASVRLARRFVAEKLQEWELEPILDDALLVTSELSANAITHAESDCQIRLSRGPARLRIDVVDAGAGTPEPQPPSATEEHGRGLHLVAALTTAWGLDHIPGDGKVVWAEISIPA